MFLYMNSDNILELKGLQDATDLTVYENAATVQVTIQDQSGAEVAGETWPVTMTYVPSSNGIYRANISRTVALSENNVYKGILTADAGLNKFITVELWIDAEKLRN